MGMNLIQDRTEEIKKELAELNSALKMSVQKAIRIGQLLTEQKEFVGHGLFLPWLEKNFDMSQQTASNYMRLFSHNDKLLNIGNLQEAYRQIETIEAQEKQSKAERERTLISEYRKTGAKPTGWTRDLDYRIKKDAEEQVKQQERIDRAKKEREQRAADYKQRQDPTTHYKLDGSMLADAASNFISKSQERMMWKEKIRISAGGKDDAFNDAIMDYLETLPDDNRRIEACNNIIKICRNISIELQKAA
jgi:hypothetical protein